MLVFSINGHPLKSQYCNAENVHLSYNLKYEILPFYFTEVFHILKIPKIKVKWRIPQIKNKMQKTPCNFT